MCLLLYTVIRFCLLFYNNLIRKHTHTHGEIERNTISGCNWSKSQTSGSVHTSEVASRGRRATLSVLPLSFLHLSLSLSCHAIKNHVRSLNRSPTTTPTRFESPSCGKSHEQMPSPFSALNFPISLPSFLLSFVTLSLTTNASLSKPPLPPLS